MNAPPRIAWAVDLFDVQPADHVLEVGCGSGVAVALVADRLTTGRVTGIDRSATAIQRARARNADQLAAGRVVLEQVDLAGYAGEPASFDKALAVNVNVFWTSAADRECAALRRMLRPGGLALLAYEAPPGSGRDLAPAVASCLSRHGFGTEVVRERGLVAVMGR